MAVIPSIITADEVNCLIHSYLTDSGFTHSAFTVKSEAQLERSVHFRKHIPRGELVELLSKALQYIEVESHWNGSSLALNCKSPFSLLESHTCSLDPNAKVPVLKIPLERPTELLSARSKATTAASPKRKAISPPEDIAMKEKRSRLSADDRMDVDSNSTQPPSDQDESLRPEQIATTSASVAVRKPTLISSASRLATEDTVTCIDDGGPVRLLRGHKTEVFVCGWNPINIGLLASGSKDAIVNIWDVPETGKPKKPLTLECLPTNAMEGDLTSLDWNPTGTLLAIGSYDAVLRIATSAGELYMSDPADGDQKMEVGPHGVPHLPIVGRGPIFAVKFSPSGRWLLTACLDGTACVWDIAAKKVHREFKCHEGYCCLDVDWIDDLTFVSCGADKIIYIIRLDTSNILRTLKGHTDEINQIKCNGKATRLASCSDDKTARIWNVEDSNNSKVVVLKGHRNAVSTMGWCPNTPDGENELLATSGFDGTARLWDTVTGECLKVFADHKRSVYALSFCPDGNWLATGSGDGWVHVYDVQKKEKVWSWFAEYDKPGVFEIDWQKTGNVNRIAVALESRQVGIIDVTKVTELQK